MGTVNQFYEYITSYTNTFWPVMVLTYLLAIFVFYFSYKKTEFSDKIISGILAFLWLWSGLIFWIGTFGPYSLSIFNLTIPGIWVVIGIVFIIQGCLLILFGIINPSISVKIEKNSYFYLGLLFVLYALFIYPIIGFLTGHPYPNYPIFGIFPCPVTIFSFGIFLWTDKKVNLILIILPLIYALCGILPVLLYEVLADLGLIIFGILGFSLITYRDKNE